MNTKAADFKPGDVVAWDLGSGARILVSSLTHGQPIEHRWSAHNIGQGGKEEDILLRHEVIGRRVKVR